MQDNEECAKNLLSMLDRALNVHSTTVWNYVLRCVGLSRRQSFVSAERNLSRSQMRLYETAGSGIVGEEFEKAMKTLALLRESDECFCKQELDFVRLCLFDFSFPPNHIFQTPDFLKLLNFSMKSGVPFRSLFNCAYLK